MRVLWLLFLTISRIPDSESKQYKLPTEYENQRNNFCPKEKKNKKEKGKMKKDRAGIRIRSVVFTLEES